MFSLENSTIKNCVIKNSASENDVTRMNLVEVQSNIGTAKVQIVAFFGLLSWNTECLGLGPFPIAGTDPSRYFTSFNDFKSVKKGGKHSRSHV